MTYEDLRVMHNPSTGGLVPAMWGDQIRQNEVALVSLIICHAHQSAGQIIADATAENLTFDSERRDNDNIHSTVNSTDQFVIRTAGFYTYWAGVKFQANGTGLRYLHASRNGLILHHGDQHGTLSGAFDMRMSLRGRHQMKVGDVIDFAVYQNSGGPLGCSAEAGLIRVAT